MPAIHCHFLAKNEGAILPYFFRHYNRYVCKYFAHYNIHSTDNTLEICQNNPVPVQIIEDANVKLDERFLVLMKNTTWKQYSNEQNCDWVILVDADEFLYDDDLHEKIMGYDRDGITFPSCKGYQMYPKDNEGFPTEEKQITELIKTGIEYGPYDKHVLLRSNINPNYSFGCHLANAQGPIVKGTATHDLKLLHYRIFDENYIPERLAVNDTLCDFNKAAGLGVYNSIPGDGFNPAVEYELIKRTAKEVI